MEKRRRGTRPITRPDPPSALVSVPPLALRSALVALPALAALGLAACGPADDGPGAERGREAATEAPAGPDAAAALPAETAERIAAINERFPFVDVHAHPSRFHRADVERITPEEVGRYLREGMDAVVASISTDAAYHGGYVTREGDTVPRGERPKPSAEEILALAEDRLERIRATAEDPRVLLAEGPETVDEARAAGDRLVVIPAFEGGDGLAGDLRNLRRFHERGLRLLQLVHFRANELGHVQTFPYSPGGLTEFGAEVVREANRLGIVLDLAHANTRTIRETVELSDDPVIFSHGGAAAVHDGDRYLEDEEIRMIAESGGVVGIWPYAPAVPSVEAMVEHVDHVAELVGVDHVAIASDLRGLGSYAEGFGEEARFRNVAAALLRAGYADAEVGKIMGGNFMRVWRETAAE